MIISRRAWMLTPAGLAASGAPEAASRPVVIGSTNGLRACARAMEILRSGGDTLDAVVAGVNLNEEDPEDYTVGYGGLPNEDGVVELDASVIHGPTRRFGSVASLRNIKNPSKVARAVMQNTDHIMLVGEGALRFARALGFREEDLLTEKRAWPGWSGSNRCAIRRATIIGLRACGRHPPGRLPRCAPSFPQPTTPRWPGRWKSRAIPPPAPSIASP